MEKRSKAFRFIDPGRLCDGDLELVLVGKYPYDPVKKYVPSYRFEMQQAATSRRMGFINLRIGSARRLRYPGHIGYGVDEKYRGRRYAARSSRLLLPLAAAHGLKSVWLTVDPQNIASMRTCEILGAKYVETVRIPRNHEMYRNGARYRRRYRITPGKKVLNPGHAG